MGIGDLVEERPELRMRQLRGDVDHLFHNGVAIERRCDDGAHLGELLRVGRLRLRLGAWRALSIKRMPATMTPAMATCPSYSATRRQRDQVAAATMSGVVVAPGTVGVC